MLALVPARLRSWLVVAAGGALALAVVFLRGMALGRAADRARRARRTLEIQHEMLDAATRRPRDRHDLARRMRDGRF